MTPTGFTAQPASLIERFLRCRVVPSDNADIRLHDADHFTLKTHGTEIAEAAKGFVSRALAA